MIDRASIVPAKVLLTGATGFLGKVVLEELLRRRDELNIATIHVMIRPRGELSAQQRFDDKLKPSTCFSLLADNWHNCIEVVPCELAEPGCGLSVSDKVRLQKSVTHIVHCAASIDFDLPLKDAAIANVVTSQEVLAFARGCKKLLSMVAVSTAYVRPIRPGALPIEERLVPMPRPAETILRSIMNDQADENELLAETGHPNTYTYTKCLAEHLLVKKRGDVPLRIVRPSIISASWDQPFRGWIDSNAAFAGFVMMIGAGYLKAVVGNPRTRLDVVPCDVVADRTINAAFDPFKEPSTGSMSVEIRHAVAGLRNSPSISQCRAGITGFFTEHPVGRKSVVNYLGPHNPLFAALEVLHHQAPTVVAKAWTQLRRQGRKTRRISRLQRQLKYINRAFPYFTGNTFDFESSVPFTDASFDPISYIETVCRGVYKHLLGQDEEAMTFAGKAHLDKGSDLLWAVAPKRREANLTMRAFGYVLRKAARRSFDKVTFDKPSFNRALAAIPPDATRVIIPSHRSYTDFLLCSYLFFERPDLGIDLPHIAAAEEFSQIPLLGPVLTRSRAFYLSRGKGREDYRLTQQVQDLVERGATLQFFIEGTRSRSRRFLEPRRGLLRCLQGTGRRFALLPIALSYERLPEEEALLKELRGGPKPKMRPGPLLAWARRMLAGDVTLGHVHARCGEPIIMDADSDVRALSHRVVAELQANTSVSNHHLDSFVQHNPTLGLDTETLANWLRERGAQVIPSVLPIDSKLSPEGELCLRYHWKHLFYRDLQEAFPGNPAIAEHVASNLYMELPEAHLDVKNPVAARLLQALAEPICEDHIQTIKALGRPNDELEPTSAKDIVRRSRGLHLPNVQSALRGLAAEAILMEVDRGRYTWGPEARDIDMYRESCRLVLAAQPSAAGSRRRSRSLGGEAQA